jgi:hypothetical protein
MSLQKMNKDGKPDPSSRLERTPDGEAFYIGWMGKAPKTFVSTIKKYVIGLLSVVIALGALLALSQKKFDTGNFEFGRLTEVKGIYFNTPVPNLKILNGKDIWGNENYITVPLIGYGKHGADGIMDELQKEQNTSFTAKEIVLRGTLLYNDGKLLMQVDGNDKPFVKISNNKINKNDLPKSTQLGEMDVKGEIVDPKCFFGVMKPGEGKPHKDCAIRCILGGMPPVLKVTDSKGRQNYYLIVGQHGEKMNEAVQNYVATPVTIHAGAVKQDDWIVLYVQNNGIKEYTYHPKPANEYLSCTSCLK